MKVSQRTYVSKAPMAVGMRVRRWMSTRYHEPGYYRMLHPFSDVDVAAFGKGIDNVISGMKERVYYIDADGTLPPPCVRQQDAVKGIIERVVSAVGPCNRVTGDEFIRSRTGSKRKMYEQARRDLMLKPATLGQLATLSFFTKTESTVWRKAQVPRIVSPRSFGFNYLLGKYMRPVEHPIFEALRSLFLGEPVVAKGMTQLQKGQEIARKLRPGWVAVGLDASRFDQTIKRTLLEIEHSVYNGIFCDQQLRQLLRCQLNNKGRAICRDGIVTADIGPMRCSGDQNTSLGNCIISCVLACLFYEEHGIKGDVFNDGDDLIMFMPEESLHLLGGLTDWYARWGLRMKVEEPARVPEQVEFCQSRPVWTPDGYLLVRNPGKALNTDYACGPRLDDPNSWLTHLRSVGLCGMAMAAGVPIYQEFYQWGVRNGKTGKFTDELRGLLYQARIEWGSGRRSAISDIHWRTRDSFWMAFGISPPAQIAMEAWFHQATVGRLDVLRHNKVLFDIQQHTSAYNLLAI